MAISRRQLITTGAGIGAAAIFAPTLLSRPAYADIGLAVSTGSIDITPNAGPNGEYLAGWGVNTPRRAASVEAPLTARCTIIWDDGNPNVIVTADTLAFPASMHQEIRRRVTGLDVASSDFVLTATHTHSGGAVVDKLVPYMAYNMVAAEIASVQNYSNWMVNQIVALVAGTLDQEPTPCSLDYKVLKTDFAHNREGLAYDETDVPTLVARALDDGRGLAILFGYGCHPVSYGDGENHKVHPDYPGPVRDWIEARTGAFTQFILGPAGDQNPKGTFGPALTAAIAAKLGTTVVNGVATPGRPITGPIRTQLTNVTLPLDITDTPANLAAVKALYRDRASQPTESYIKRHAKVMVQQIDAHSFETSVPLPLQRWTFQGAPGLSLIFTGGELVSGYAVWFRQRHGGSDALWITGYANEIPAYIPSDELIFKDPALGSYDGGFEANQPGIGGGSMCVYGYLGHFKGRPLGTTQIIGVEQILTSAITALLASA